MRPLDLFRRSGKRAAHGDAQARNDLGDAYRFGDRVTQDHATAVAWYRKAAEQGDAEGQSKLGGMYLRGEGVARDLAMTTSWWRKAAEQGLAEAQFDLGLTYEFGWTAPPDPAAAAAWYRKAAEQGFANAQHFLGLLYVQGRGVLRDMVQAHLWLHLARAQGEPVADEHLAEIAAGITPAQRAEAEALVLAWKAKPEQKAWAEERRRLETSPYRHGPDGPRSRWRGELFSRLLRLFAKGLRLTPLYRRGRQNALDPRLVELEIALPDLPPAFDGLRILHVSDTHLDVLPELADVARELIANIEVDLLALTGDIHGDHHAPLALSTALLAKALEGVRGRRVAVLGNHDPAAMIAPLEALDFEVLVNRSLVLERGGERLRLTGLDDVHYFYTDRARAALDDHEGECRIALVHSPEMADHAAAAGYALYLCGHTHGGQICLPGGRPIFTQLARCHHAASGLWQQGRMIGYTSRGLGVSTPPVRFNNRGEVSLITLRRAS